MWAAIASMLLGIWLMVAPSVLGYGGAVRTNDHVVGPIVATFAAIAICQSTRNVRWANTVLGLWLVLAPLVLGAHGALALHGIGVGGLLMGLSFLRGTVRRRFDGGWAVLWHPPSARA